MSHWNETFICPHCGERLQLEEKRNKVGDLVRRAICYCPDSPTVEWSSDWELVTKAPQ